MTHPFLKFIFIATVVLIVSFFILNFSFPLTVKINYSQVVLAEDGSLLHAYLNKNQKWRIMIETGELNSRLKNAFLFKEDKRFYYHPGVDPFALLRAFFNNTIESRKTSGASTITMQVARLLQPAKRTYGNKLKEMFRAMQLEMYYTKDEILQMYLNLIPYGGNIEGIKAASLLYYGRLPDMLSLSQLITLIIIPNRPTSLRPGKNDRVLASEKNKWLTRLKEEEIISTDEINSALAEPVIIKRMQAPAEAQQFSRKMAADFPEIPIIKTNLNRGIQKKVESIAFTYLTRIRLMNIHNIAVLVVENKSKKIKAYVGSADFTDGAHGGEMDGIQAIRSPGSTLKPLVYALAIDKGLITPKTTIHDVPVNFAGYRPENFNSKFNGRVTVEKALAFSLNIPAVKILNETGVSYFSQKLKQAGFHSVDANQKNMGLSMVLGGCGVSLFELAGLYSCFASNGQYEPLKFLTADTFHLQSTLVSESAAYLISEILTLPLRPDLPNNYQSSLHIPKIAWKTGTSYGRRDAWSIGYNKKYTIAVWSGNFDGTGVPELTGADIATPLLFNLFNSLDYNSPNDWFKPPAAIDFRLVCSVSGLPPDMDCIDQVLDYFIPGVSAYQKCTHLTEVYVSSDQKFSYCTQCLPDAGYKKIKYPNDAPELLTYYRTEHIEFISPPPHNPNCTRVFKESPPKITSPVNNKEYLIQKGEDDEIELKCQVASDVNKIYWYIDNEYYKSATPSESLFFKPHSGAIKISCSDDKGRNTDCHITITNY